MIKALKEARKLMQLQVQLCVFPNDSVTNKALFSFIHPNQVYFLAHINQSWLYRALFLFYLVLAGAHGMC